MRRDDVVLVQGDSMDIDPTAPRRPWLASTNRIVFLLICVVSASIASVICLITCVMIYALNNIDVNIGAPISIVISLFTFIVTIAILIRRRSYLNSPDWLFRQSNQQHQAATRTAARAAREAAAQKEWQAAQAAAQEAQRAAFQAAAETAKEAAARKEWQAAQSGAETRSGRKPFDDMYVQKSHAALLKEAAWFVAKMGLVLGVLGLMFAMFTVLPPLNEGNVVILAIVAFALLLFFLPTLLLMSRGLPWGWTLFFNILIGWTGFGHLLLLARSLIRVWQADGDARQSARVAESEARILAEMHKQSQKSETF
jgi:hypothetical protein